MTFAIKGNTEVPKKELKHKIERLGGTVVENMDKTTTACVSTKGAKLSSETDAYIVCLCTHTRTCILCPRLIVNRFSCGVYVYST